MMGEVVRKARMGGICALFPRESRRIGICRERERERGREIKRDTERVDGEGTRAVNEIPHWGMTAK